MSILDFRRLTPTRPTLAPAAPTTIGDDGWLMVQLDPKVNEETGQRQIVGRTGPMSRDDAYDTACEQANRRDGWVYGIRQADSDEVQIVDPGDFSYIDHPEYPYEVEQAPAVAA